MPTLSKDSNGYYRIAVSPEIVRLFHLQEGAMYDWENVNGFPALKERR